MKTKELTLIGTFVAVLIAVQLALSFISGVELVTVLLLSFCFVFGIRLGCLVATAFSLIRCLIFGFNVNVIILYLIYYNLFALFFGFLGNKMSCKITVSKHIIVCVSAVLFTMFFTLLDDVITPIFYGFSLKSAKMYFISSLYVIFPHMLNALITVLILAIPLIKLFYSIKNSQNNDRAMLDGK